MSETNLYPFQEQVFNTLREGRSIILQAPTGAGKTRAALYPFLYYLAEPDPTAFPRRCIYSTPMRVLVNQFGAEYDEIVARYDLRYGLQLRRGVTIQTGERPEDRFFAGDLIFTTIDQTLSNVLGVPYAVSAGKANLNAGAIIGSYLVFDEFHLFPPDGALKTTLQVLRLLCGITPFVLMTATFSKTMLSELEELLGAQKVTVSSEELAKIPSQQNKTRRFHWVGELLSARAVLDRHDRRSIAICNTVDRAQALYDGLLTAGCRAVPVGVAADLDELYAAVRQHPGWEQATWVVLLHSRFTREHRHLKEEFVRREFGNPEKVTRQIPRLILVATQVVEVGLDITCQALHTEIAPANSVIQRAGRCARFAREQGDVYIYAVPLDKRGEPNYRPYAKGLCEATRAAFAERGGQEGIVLDFQGEQEVIEEVHAEADRKLLADMRAEERQIRDKMVMAMGLGESSVRADLIRRVDSRTLLVHDEPKKLGNPFACRGFSLWHGTLRGKFEELWEWADKLDLDWVLKRPVEVEDEDAEDREDSRAPVRFEWVPVSSKEQLSFSTLFVIHPALVAYDAERGFRFTAEGGGNYCTEPPARDTRSTADGDYVYRLESYAEHVRGMLAVYRQELAEPMAYVAARMEQRLGLPHGSVLRSTRLAIGLHDVGKLQKRWQQWARAYQEAIGEPLDDPAFMVAHTHSETPEHREIAKRVRPKRPRHAGEGAVAVAKLVHRAVGGNEILRRAVLTAIARHHTPHLNRFNEKYRLDEHARAAIAEALEEVSFAEGGALAEEVFLSAPATKLENLLLQLPDENPFPWWLLYFLIVRAVRLADMGSQATL